MQQYRGTTICAVRRGAAVAIAGDGQVSMGDTVMKGNARKVRRLYHDRVVAGFAGGTADAFTLFERFEAKLEAYSGNLERAAVELAKDWRSDRMLRRLEALLCVADTHASLIISGNGDVIAPEHDAMAIGSGGQYALAALSDPWATGADWLGISPFYVTTGFFNHMDSVRVIWLTQAGAVVIGHVWSVMLAHRMALNLFPKGRKAALATAPLSAFMIGYTFLGLWLLAAPRGA